MHALLCRTYLSMVDPSANTVYTCSVEENGEQGPRVCNWNQSCLFMLLTYGM